MFDVTQNNWLLPLKDEYFIVSTVRVEGLKVRMAHEVPTVFHGLNTASWWYDHFEAKTCKDLKAACKALGLQTNGTKSLLVAVLAKYWRDRIRDGVPA